MTRSNVDLAASIRQRLLNLSKKSEEDFSLVLAKYAAERLLYRLSRSPFASQFALKGAMLFTIWIGRPHRPTRDMDLLGYGEDSVDRIAKVFQQIIRTEVEPDGLVYDEKSISVSTIREDQEYGGKRVELMARLGVARIHVQVDIGFGDAITPEAQEIEYPSLLKLPAAKVFAYSRETVVAEKLQAMVVLGILNSRMKDFYDLWLLCEKFSFDGLVLAKAIAATFERRRTALPLDPPIALTAEFGTTPDKVVQWQAFLRRSHLEAQLISDVISRLSEFLLPILSATARQAKFTKRWEPGGPWR